MDLTTNGYLFPGQHTYTEVIRLNSAIPANTVPNNLIAPYWTDLDLAPSGKGQVFTALFDDLVNPRILVVQYKNVGRHDDTGSTLNFEVIFTEGSPDFVMLYGATTDSSTTLTVGLENLTGTGGTQYYYNNDIPANRPATGLGIKWTYHSSAAPPAATTEQIDTIQKVLQNSPTVISVPLEIVKRAEK